MGDPSLLSLSSLVALQSDTITGTKLKISKLCEKGVCTRVLQEGLGVKIHSFKVLFFLYPAHSLTNTVLSSKTFDQKKDLNL